MADDIPSPAKGVYIFFDYVALGFVLVAIEEFVRHMSEWRVWVGCLVLGAVFLSIGVMGARLKTWLFRVVNAVRHSKALSMALAENADLKTQVDELKKNQRQDPAQSKLKIHSALYGAGNSDDIDLTEILQKMVPMDGLAVRINNNLIVGRPDPAPTQPKTLRIAYSYGNDTDIRFSRPERALLVLPRDFELIQETAAEHDRERKRQVEALQKIIDEKPQPIEGIGPVRPTDLIIKSARYGPPDGLAWENVTLTVYGYIRNDTIDLVVSHQAFPERSPGLRTLLPGVRQKFILEVLYAFGDTTEKRVVRFEGDRLQLPEPIAINSDMRALPSNASNGDKMRRERAISAFNKLSVPQRFALRCISRLQRVSFSNLVQFGQEAGFGPDPTGYINDMTSFCELIKIEGNNNFMIEPAFIGDVDVILAAWFTRIASSSETLF